jgi:hypothetical protein
MNTLMNLIDMPLIAKSETNTALVIIEGNKPDLVKSTNRVADSLRAAGFVVSTQVDNEDKKDFKWIIEVNGKPADFVIYNRSNKRKLTAKTIADVVKLLGGKGVS